MKFFFTSILLSSLIAASAFADSITCLDHHEDLATNKINASIRQSALAFFKKKNIAVDSVTLTIATNESPMDDDGDMYATYTLDDGTITAKDGTVFNIIFSGPLDDDNEVSSMYFAGYLPKWSGQGFDKEGNPINAHCSVQLGTINIQNPATGVSIQNARSGRILGTFALPKSFVAF